MSDRSNSTIALDRAQNLIDAKNAAEEFFEPHLGVWLDLETIHENLTLAESHRDFHLDEITETGIDFTSGPWDETWQYGGFEQHYGNTIRIPFEFFDDHEPFIKAAKDARDARVDAAKARVARDKKAQVARLEAQLAKAKQEG